MTDGTKISLAAIPVLIVLILAYGALSATKTGVKLWEFETGDVVASSPAIGFPRKDENAWSLAINL